MQKFLNLRTAILISLGLILVPSFLYAQGAQEISAGIRGFSELVNLFNTTVVRSIATLFLSLAILAFFYGIVEYIWGRRAGDTDKVKNGNSFMTWGLVALFVMFSVYGIIKFAQNVLFDRTDINTITIPEVNFGGSGGSNTGAGRPSGTGGTGGNGLPGGTVCSASNVNSSCSVNGFSGTCRQNQEDGSYYCSVVNP